MKKRITKAAAFLMALVLAFTVLPADVQAASSVKLNKSRITLYTGGTTVLKVTGTSRKARFTSSRKSVATVNSKGKVTAKKAGVTVITAKVGNKKLVCRVAVKAENLKLSKKKMTLFVKGSATMKLAGTSRTVKWSSSNKSVAIVSKQGKVTAKKAGTTMITAKVGKQKAVCKVTVKKENLKLNKSQAAILKGDSATLRVSGIFRQEGWDEFNRKIKWRSSNESVAAVTLGDSRDEIVTEIDTQTGKVSTNCMSSYINQFTTSTVRIKAKKVGTATITFAISGGKTLKCKVTVKEKTQAQKDTVAIYWNGEKTVKASGAAGTVKWESSNNSIVAVKDNGMNTATFTGKKVGKATVCVKVDGKVFKKYTVDVKMKTTPVTAKEEELMDWAVNMYEWPDSFLSSSDLAMLGASTKDEARKQWITHKRALASARKLLPGRDIHIIDVDSLEKCWAKQHELSARNVRYLHLGGISHDHGKTEKWAVAWIE